MKPTAPDSIVASVFARTSCRGLSSVSLDGRERDDGNPTISKLSSRSSGTAYVASIRDLRGSVWSTAHLDSVAPHWFC